ncbi:AMP-dependent synthetase/ligase [Intrasporangium calvum]|uniref:Acyl-CoA synthetase n=1 Tax=Intrasporangium calvum (strain ATCC 23552 / DSM 43043 / JCM 3097 / NBRC 12989 / NCIMB 10167 / NRRL B-3866 / 7 KIP) TaxID=710696 RepID=E6SBX7_INTC7|nr:AMP-dependent synthetase/ligase [Intrasporangium calvum]ADU48486.1 AMP-dependent synthetase and ligase [Intrasporangium calvum DSM 43043]AXG13506.1 long-chain fatty acid--CoA ligase [Intrasporangium calvum]
MKDKDVAAVVPTTTEGTLAELPRRNAKRAPTDAAFSKKGADGQWTHVTWGEFAAEVTALAKGLIAAGVDQGDRIGLMCRTRYEWTLVDFAAWSAGAVVVPIYETSSPEQVEWILSDSGAKLVVVESPTHRDTVEQVRDRVSTLGDVYTVDEGDLDRLTALGRDVPDDALAEAQSGLDRTSVATIIYTSGTTGRPKGVQLTHGNFLDLVENAIEKLGAAVLAPGSSTLLFLPLAHVFARFIEVLCVASSVRMGHTADAKAVVEDFGTFRPTFILAVPRVFERVFNAAEAKAAAGGKDKIFHRAATVAIAHSEALDHGGPGLSLRLQHALFDKLVYSKLRAAMGGQVRYAVSGGGPLGTRLGHFFRGIGINILEGYGLTETTAPVAVNVPDKVKIGTVGPPLPGTSIRIADDGEILVRGVGVFNAYHDNEQATSEAIRDGWFHTGDLGDLDEDGYLRITGRKKEILVTSGGKNVAPAVLEDRLRAHPLVSQCIVVGDQKPFIAAMVTLDPEMWPLWAASHGLENVSIEEARSHPKVLEVIQHAVDRANEAVSKAESIRKFVVLSGDFTEANGYLTPSLKMKRNIVMKDFATEVEKLYS